MVTLPSDPSSFWLGHTQAWTEASSSICMQMNEIKRNTLTADQDSSVKSSLNREEVGPHLKDKTHRRNDLKNVEKGSGFCFFLTKIKFEIKLISALSD